jgi:hypothetical protein
MKNHQAIPLSICVSTIVVWAALCGGVFRGLTETLLGVSIGWWWGHVEWCLGAGACAALIRLGMARIMRTNNFARRLPGASDEYPFATGIAGSCIGLVSGMGADTALQNLVGFPPGVGLLACATIGAGFIRTLDGVGAGTIWGCFILVGTPGVCLGEETLRVITHIGFPIVAVGGYLAITIRHLRTEGPS